MRDGRDRERPAQAGYTSNDVKVRGPQKKIPVCFFYRGVIGLRYIHKWSIFEAVLPAGWHEALHRSSFPRTGARGVHAHPVSAFMMMSLAHASTSKLTRVLSMRQSVTSRTPAPQKRAGHRLRRFLQFGRRKKKNFLIIEHWLNCNPCIHSTIFPFRRFKYLGFSIQLIHALLQLFHHGSY